MKSILVNPPSPDQKKWFREGRCQQLDIWGAPFPPLSLALIARQLTAFGEVLIIDAGAEGLDLGATIKKIIDFAPDFMVLSTATPTIDGDLGWFLPALKKELSDLKTVTFGVHVTELAKETMEKYPLLDFIVCHEPEMIIKNLVSAVWNNGELSSVLGLVWKNNGEININQLAPLIENLDELGLAYWNGVDFKKYLMPIVDKPFALVVFARGCPFSCKYCTAHTYYGRRVRRRSVEMLMRDIDQLVERGVTDFLFWTEFMTNDLNFLKKFLDSLIQKGLAKKIRWVANSRVDFADEAVFRKMRAAGCWQVAFGFEFGSDQILRLAGKGGQATIAQGRVAAKAASRAGLTVDGHFILGYPGETEITLRETVNYAKSLPLTFAHFYAATPFPGSDLYHLAVNNKYITASDWENFKQDKFILKTPSLMPETVQRYIGKAYKEFYFRLQIPFRILRIAKNPREFLSVIKVGFKFVGYFLGF